jgi:dCMP deaminase
MVYSISQKSKDRYTKIGSVIVTDNQIVKIGYNGLPVGVNDDLSDRHERPKKYQFYIHSEINAIIFAARGGVSTNNSTIYTNAISCQDCAKAIIQAGIKKVVYHKQFQDIWEANQSNQWSGHRDITELLFSEAKVELMAYDKILNVEALVNGQIYNL